VRRAEVPQPSGPAQVEAPANGTGPAATGAEAIVNGADPAPATAAATAANAEANAASPATAEAVAAADAELAAAVAEAADDAAQAGGADGQ
jgi:hypothetical protein